MPNEVTVVILTHDESRNIVDCISTARWADDVLVFDSFSDDDTVPLARDAGARVLQRPFDNYAAQRNSAMDAVDTPWVFFLDADERIPEALVREIREAAEDREKAGWWVPRHNHIVGKVVMHAGWYPDYQLRLLRRGRAMYDPSREVHEIVLLDGPAGHLRTPLEHYNYDTWEQFHAKQRIYMSYEAGIMFKQGIRPKPHNFVLQPLREFRRRYFTLEGWKDGFHGLRLSLLMAYYNWVMYRNLASLWRERQGLGNRG